MLDMGARSKKRPGFSSVKNMTSDVFGWTREGQKCLFLRLGMTRDEITDVRFQRDVTVECGKHFSHITALSLRSTLRSFSAAESSLLVNKEEEWEGRKGKI